MHAVLQEVYTAVVIENCVMPLAPGLHLSTWMVIFGIPSVNVSLGQADEKLFCLATTNPDHVSSSLRRDKPDQH